MRIRKFTIIFALLTVLFSVSLLCIYGESGASNYIYSKPILGTRSMISMITPIILIDWLNLNDSISDIGNLKSSLPAELMNVTRSGDNNKTKSITQRSISMGIPAIWNDRFLVKLLISDIENIKSNRPEEIVVAMSNVPNDDESEKYRNYLESKGITYILESSKRYAGWARNVVANLTKSEYISFVDADDTINPKLFDIALHVIKGGNYSIILHGYSKNNTNLSSYEPNGEKQIPTVSGDELLKIAKRKGMFYRFAHHGHPIVRRTVFEKYQYHEKMKRAQDIEFLLIAMNSINDASKFISISLPLTIYSPRGARKSNKRRNKSANIT